MITPEQWNTAKDLFAGALARGASERGDWLRSLKCESTTRNLVLQLLAAHSRIPEDFLTEPNVLVPGQILRRRFRVTRLVGRGGMAQVYEAEDLQLNQRVALKTLHRHFSSEDGLERLKAEIANARRVTDLSVCRLYDIDVETSTDPPIFFLTMEFLDGETLAARLERLGPMTVARALPLIRQCAGALDAAHREGVVHGDFKSSNIFLCRFPGGEQRTVVTDFGLSRAIEADESAGEALWGTPAYMAPELLAGRGTSTASDIYAFGVVIREIVGLESGRTRWPVGGQWHRVIEHCLERDPERRPRLASDVARRLEAKLPRAGIAAVILTLLIALSMLVDSIGSRPRLAILPIDVEPETEEAEALARGLVQLLASQLSSVAVVGTSFLVIAPAEIQEHAITTPSLARRLMGATDVLSGTLQRREDRLILTVNRIDTGTLGQRSISRNFFIHEVPALQRALFEASLDLLDVEISAETIAAAVSTDSISPGYEFYVQGLGYLERGPEHAQSALKLFEEALKRDRALPVALAGAAEANLRLFNTTKLDVHLDQARAQLDAAAGLAPHSLSVLMARGFLATVTGHLEEAIDAYEAANRLAPFNGDIYRRLANAYRRVGNDAAAEAAYQRAIQMRPDYWAGFLDLGGFYYQRGEFEKARDSFERVTALAPDNVRGHVALGGTYTSMQRYGEAEVALRRALRLNPMASVYSSLGALFSRQHRFDEAIHFLNEGTQAHPEDVMIWLNLGRALTNAKGPEAARPAYQRASTLAQDQLAINSRDAELQSRLALAEANLAEEDRALRDISEARALAPRNVSVLLNAVLVYERIGRRHLAVAVCREYGTKAILTQLQSFPELTDLRLDPNCRNRESFSESKQ